MSNLLTFLCKTEPQFRKSRLPALYSDFRQLRTTNPDGYIANISAWLQGLASAARAGAMPTASATPDLLILTFNHDLLHALETEDGQPLALGAVINEGIEKGQLYPFREFMESQQSIYHKGWAIRPMDILTWGLKQLGLGSQDYDDHLFAVGKVVLLENLEIAGKEAQKRFDNCRGRSERVFTCATFAEMFGDIFGPKTPLSELDMKLLLKFLERDKGLIFYDAETVKLTSQNEKKEITLEDTTIASLKALMKDLEIQILALTQRLDVLSITAREAVSKKNRPVALAALRSKKLTETTLGKRHVTLAQLEEVFSKIEQATGLVELTKVMEASTQVLTGLNKEIGGVVRVEDVVDRLREQIELVDEVGHVAVIEPQVDIDEMDDELEAMVHEEKEQREKTGALTTKLRLDALEGVELQAQLAIDNKSKDSEVERDLAKSTEGLEELSLDAGIKAAE